MKSRILMATFLLLITVLSVQAQGKVWSLQDCINYALDKNIQVQKAGLTTAGNQLYFEKAQASRLPSLNASVSQNFNWYKGFDSSTGTYGNSKGSNSSSYALSSNVSLFNGQKIDNQIKQTDINLQAGQYYSETVKESIGVNILNAYLQVLYAYESVSNAEKQIVSTTEQLALAKERLDLGVVSMSDYLQVKSELSTEKSTLATAQSNLSIYKVTLMQLMELPVDPNFNIISPKLDSLLVQTNLPNSQEVYNLALGIKPQIKNAELTTQSAELNVKIAKADAAPSLSMNAGLSSGYSSLTTGADYSSQLKNKINPVVGLSLSIPIFQKKQIKTNIGIATIAVDQAELDAVNTKNELRKSIEQACVDVVSAQSKYAASLEEKQSAQESYDVAEEKYKLGLLNSVDFLIQKTNLITSESKLLQTKYNVVFSNKILDFYKGISLAL